MLAWIILIISGFCEIGWPFGLKIAQNYSQFKIAGFLLAAVSIIISGVLLYIAQKSITIGTAYAVWTGIGAAGTFILGIIVFGDTLNMGRVLGVCLIVGGVISLKLSS